MSDDAQEWRWVGEDGVEKTVGEQELIAELSSESLPNYTLVWKKGWLEWLPAMQVAELLWALPPGKADAPVKPREKPTAAQPPAPPLYRYPVIKRRAATAKADKPPAGGAPKVAPKPIAPLEPPTQIWVPVDPKPVEEVDMDSIESSNPEATEDEVPSAPTRDDDVTVVRDVDYSGLPEELEDDRPSGENEVVSAPLAARAYGEEDDVETRVLRSRPPPPGPGPVQGPLYVAPHAPPPTSDHAPDYDDLEDMPRIPPPPAPPSDLSAYAGVSSGQESTTQRTLGMVGIGAALTVAAVLGVSSLMRGKHEIEVPLAPATSARTEGTITPAGVATAAVAVRAPPPPLGKACTITTPATKVADWADPGIVPSFAAVPGSERVVVGFGQSDTYAIGITIDPKTLDHDQVFREFRRQKLASVVPTAEGGNLHFQVVRGGFPIDNARAVDAPSLFFLGTTAEGLVEIVGKSDPSLVWAFPTAESTVPRVATVAGVGHAVAFRHGGKTGKIAIGWLGPSGVKKTELLDVEAHGTFVGTPSIAANEESILVAFASRNDGSPWSIDLAVAKAGQLPTKTVTFTLPTGGPGGDGMSPSLGTLAGGRWLLQWTEGSSGNRVARAQILGEDLKPVSPPVGLSPEGMNAGQGAVWAAADVGTVLFYAQNDRKSHALWGTSIDCPR